MNMKKLAPFALGLAMLAGVAAPTAAVMAAYDPTIPGIGNTNLPTTSAKPTEIILNVIKVAMGVLALIAVVFIMYGGFMWLTAGGSEDRLKKAKEIISAAVIGLVVVLLAYIIVTFVARITTSTVNGNTSGV